MTEFDRQEARFTYRVAIALVLILTLLACFAADAAIVLPPLTPNFDSTLSTKYPNGDKPQDEGTCPPTGWTLLARGTAAGEICDVSGDFQVTTSGQDDEGDQLQVYQTCGTDDCEVIARVPAVSEWLGHQETFTQFLVGISEGTGDSAWYFHAAVTPDGRVRCKAGTPGPDDYNAVGSAGQLPEYIAVTHDDSLDELRCLQSDDGITWSTFGTFSKALAEPAIGYVGGTSHDSSASTTATLESPSLGTTITTYTPDPPDPGGNDPPVCEAISNQSGTQGIAITPVLPVCVDPDVGDTISYSATGLSGRGLSISSTTGAITGTPNATAVSASPFTVQVTATDNGGAQGQVSFQFSISSSSSDNFTVGTGAAATFDCNAQGVGPGDTITLAGGVHATARLFRNCFGSASSYITIRNDTTSGSRTTIRVPNGRPRHGLALENIEYVKVTGLGGWSGQTGRCGIDDDRVTERTDGCGIYIDGVTNGGAQSMILVQGLSRFVTLEGIEYASDWSGPGDSNYTVTTGISIKEADRCRADHPGEWREGFLIRKMYGHNTRAALTYFGVNQNQECGSEPSGGGQIENRDWIVEYNLFTDSGSNGIHAKRFPEVVSGNLGDLDTLIIRYNHVADIGGSDSQLAAGATDRGLSCADASCTAYGNKIYTILDDPTPADDVDGPGMTCTINHRPTEDGTQRCHFYNNEIVDTQGHGINANDGGPASMVVNFEYNTIVNPGADSGNCINAGGSVTGSATNNICAAPAAGRQDITGGLTGEATNLKGAEGAIGFVNTATDNYKLQTSSAAKNNANGSCPADDLTGIVRPQGGTCDKGAHEFDE